jgi:hypothetical protein
MYAEDAPDDDEVRQSHNFAPGYHGLVYRADVPDWGSGEREHGSGNAENEQASEAVEGNAQAAEEPPSKKITYKLQSMKWGMLTLGLRWRIIQVSQDCRIDSILD